MFAVSLILLRRLATWGKSGGVNNRGKGKKRVLKD